MRVEAIAAVPTSPGRILPQRCLNRQREHPLTFLDAAAAETTRSVYSAFFLERL